jgi:hypothetical protein
MKRFLILIVAALASFSLSSCMPSCENSLSVAQKSITGSCFKVSLYGCSDKPIRVFYAKYVYSLHQSDGWEFVDSQEGRVIGISGNVVIEEVDKSYCETK